MRPSSILCLVDAFFYFLFARCDRFLKFKVSIIKVGKCVYLPKILICYAFLFRFSCKDAIKIVYLHLFVDALDARGNKNRK